MESSIANPAFSEAEEEGFDLNVVDNVTEGFDTTTFPEVSFQVEEESGNYQNAVVQGQSSADGEMFYDMPGVTMTGPGTVEKIDIGLAYFRLRVKVAEGEAATGKVTFNAKR